MQRQPDTYRAADHAAKQRSEKQKTDLLLAHCEAWLMKRAATAEEARRLSCGRSINGLTG